MRVLGLQGSGLIGAVPSVGSTMRLYFHLVHDQDTILDPEGVEITDLWQAGDEALREVRKLRQDDPSAAQDWAGWTFRVTDASGRVVLSVSLEGDLHC